MEKDIGKFVNNPIRSTTNSLTLSTLQVVVSSDEVNYLFKQNTDDTVINRTSETYDSDLFLKLAECKKIFVQGPKGDIGSNVITYNIVGDLFNQVGTITYVYPSGLGFTTSGPPDNISGLGEQIKYIFLSSKIRYYLSIEEQKNWVSLVGNTWHSRLLMKVK